ncbi:hypothetical protein ABZ400_01885 [Streptomyces sp. NPDC005897]|uniref:hypothetical protein n=1 Tax=Streptomyces sp. NPDC005897 TaxID=3157081 RepID=UPI0033EAD51D
MSTANHSIPAEVACHVLNHYGRGGYPAGDWTASLISLIDRADMVHQAKLTTAFPDYGAAIALAKYDEEGIATLQRIAGLPPTPITCKRCWGTDGPFTPDGLCEACARPMPLDGVA